MIRIGEYQVLTIKREKPQGFYLADEEDNEVLMPRAYVTDEMKIGDQRQVFVYCDSDDLEIATTETPILVADQFAFLRVTAVNEIGAFCDWGVSKELLIPFRNQGAKLQEGNSYVIHLYLDEVSDRLVGTTKLGRFLRQTASEDLQTGQEVDLLVYRKTELGYKVIVNQDYAGLVYENESPDPLRIGQQLKGYLKAPREDGKLDVSLFPIGHQNIEPNSRRILKQLKENQGFLPFTDKSDPALIREQFGISKKLFKKALGALYKQKLVRLEADGIQLIQKVNQGPKS
jgi:hypothetical protein